MRFFLVKICFYSNIYYVVIVNFSLNDGMCTIKKQCLSFCQNDKMKPSFSIICDIVNVKF